VVRAWPWALVAAAALRAARKEADAGDASDANGDAAADRERVWLLEEKIALLGELCTHRLHHPHVDVARALCASLIKDGVFNE
jgi:hypothetical protein